MMGDSTTGDRQDSTDGETDDEDAEEDDDQLTRRGFVRATGATAAAGTAATALGAEEATAQAQTYRFGGDVAAWHGRAPSRIEGEENPTVELQAGQEYEFWFENIDGQPHNITIQDSEGNNIAESDLIREEGATASVTFTATSEMVQYICTVHPTTMVGDVNVTGQSEGGGQGGGIDLGPAVFVTGLVLAFLSPLLFAVFLFSRDRGAEGEMTHGT